MTEDGCSRPVDDSKGLKLLREALELPIRYHCEENGVFLLVER
jgi:hypothetical protein